MRTLILFFILIILIGISGFFFEDIRATQWDYVWYGYADTGYFKAPIIYEIQQCNHLNAVGCIMGDTNNYRMIIVAEMYNPYGCTLRAHEWFHLMGYEEYEIQRCAV